MHGAVQVKLEFFVREDALMRKVQVQLSSGSLAPLFFAFGLITADQLHMTDSQPSDTNFLGWLRDQVRWSIQSWSILVWSGPCRSCTVAALRMAASALAAAVVVVVVVL